MSALHDKIKAIMEGKVESDKEKQTPPTKSKEGKSEEEERPNPNGVNKTEKDDNEMIDKYSGKNGTGAKPGFAQKGGGSVDGEFGTGKLVVGGKKDKAEVKEAQEGEEEGHYKTADNLPDSAVGKSGKEDNAKGHLSPAAKMARSDKAEEKTVAANKATGDKEDPAKGTDNDKIQKNRSGSVMKGEKLPESFTSVFEGEELSEEFIAKAETIFEASVAYAVEQKVAELHEEYQVQLDEAIEEAKGELVEQIDGYLDYVVEQWIQDNAVALESGMKVELVNSFIDGIKGVFAEHYVDIPEDKIDVVEEQASEIESLQAQLAEAEAIAEAALVETQVLKCEEIVSSLSEGLTAMQAEKFASLIENVEFESEEEFADKAKIVRESFFKTQGQNSQDTTKPITEETQVPSMADAVLKNLKSGPLKFVR